MHQSQKPNSIPRARHSLFLAYKYSPPRSTSPPLVTHLNQHSHGARSEEEEEQIKGDRAGGDGRPKSIHWRRQDDDVAEDREKGEDTPEDWSPAVRFAKMTSRLWRMYAEREFYKWEKTVLWDMIEPYRRPKSFTPLVSVYVAAFYSGVVGSAITEQLYKEKYWEEHPGELVPIMPPKFYWGPWRVMNGEVPRYNVPNAANPQG
ncbi:uncharacterized protein A4U43_C01F32940 [Asparagus officinalis]|uniref:Uncharacterized protein n=2 Tax=Asparagus officinalis TaxID=4686 RepID=A0A5P1FUX9_ASPOF|nr:uncharacterized protein A4U43_C01F32940 [Asparagus officinalis]